MKKKLFFTVLAILSIAIILVVFIRPILSTSNNLLEYPCKLMGGKWTCIPSFNGCIYHKCVSRYNDAGKPCTNSNECHGKHCVLSEKQLDQFNIRHDGNTFFSGGYGEIPTFQPEVCSACTLEEQRDFGTKFKKWPTTMDIPSNIGNQGECLAYPTENCEGVLEIDSSQIKLFSGECVIQ